MFDGDKADPNAQSKLDYNKTLAFKDFKLSLTQWSMSFQILMELCYINFRKSDLFTLFDFLQSGHSTYSTL